MLPRRRAYILPKSFSGQMITRREQDIIEKERLDYLQLDFLRLKAESESKPNRISVVEDKTSILDKSSYYKWSEWRALRQSGKARPRISCLSSNDREIFEDDIGMELTQKA